MRLPFLQMESDLIAHGAAEVAHLAGCPVALALGHIAMVRAWAVSAADDSAPPDGWVAGEAAGRRIEAAAQWTGERGRLLQALLDAGQVRSEEGGIRVLHLEPYVKTWEVNRTSKERMRKLRERSANNGERTAKFDGQTQTQTQTQKEEKTSSAPVAPAPSQGSLVDSPKRTSVAEEFRDWARTESRKMLPPDAPDNCALGARNWPMLGKALKAQGVAKMQAAFRLFAADAYWKAQGLPLTGFVAKWEQYAGRVVAQGDPQQAQPRKLVEM